MGERWNGAVRSPSQQIGIVWIRPNHCCFYLTATRTGRAPKVLFNQTGLSFRPIQGDFLSWIIPGATNEDMQEATVRGSGERARGADVAELVARQCDGSPEVSMVQVKTAKHDKNGFYRSPVEIKTLPQAQITIFIGGINMYKPFPWFIIVLPTLLWSIHLKHHGL